MNFDLLLRYDNDECCVHGESVLCERTIVEFAKPDKKISTAATKETRGIHPMLFQCWASVEDGGPTLKQHWVNAPCLLGYCSVKSKGSICLLLFKHHITVRTRKVNRYDMRFEQK